MKYGSPSFTKDKRSDTPKAVTSYTSAPAMVCLSKPAHFREEAITDKTGGCNNEAGVWERTLTDAPQGTRVNEK